MVRVTWPDHLLDGTELPVHGWHQHDGQIHLVVTLPDGSRAYFRASKTSLWDAVTAEPPEFVLTADSVRKLRDIVETLQARRGHSQRAKGSK